MIDFLLGIAFAALLVRGWMRGFVKELMDVAGLVVGIIFAFRLSAPAGDFFGSWTGLSDGPARIAGGIAVFLLVGIAASVGAHYLGRALDRPGLKMSNRLLGAALAMAWGWALATLVLSVVVVMPFPKSITDPLDASTLVEALTNPELPTQQAFHSVAGDRALESVLALQRLVGNREVVVGVGERIELEPQEASQLVPDEEAALEVFAMLNAERVRAGVDPLSWSEGLESVGQGHATEMYVEGYFAHESPVTGDVGDRLQDDGLRYRLAGENLALAATPGLVHEGLMRSAGHRENIERPEFVRVGIAVIDGPLGLMVVQVFTG